MSSHAATPEQRPFGRAHGLLIAASVALIAIVLVLPARDALIDDSYITLCYVRNLLEHGVWGLAPAEPANTATSPLNVLALAALSLVTGDPLQAVPALSVCAALISCTMLGALAARERLAWWFAPLSTLLLLFNPLLQSTLGLETQLGIALLLANAAAVSAGRPLACGVTAALCALTRPDLAVYVLCVALFFPAARTLRALSAFVVVALPWYAWSWWQLGSLLPDTLIIKTNSGTWAGFTFADGPLLLARKFPVEFFASAVMALFGLGALALLAARGGLRVASEPQPATRVLALASLVHYCAFSQLGVPPYHWYYGPCVACWTVLAAPRETTSSRGLVVVPCLVLMSLAALTAARGGPWRHAPIMANRALPAEYRAYGVALARQHGDITIIAPSELGTLTYFCRCALMDVFSDRGLTNALISERLSATQGLRRTWLAFNYRYRNLDVGPRPTQARLVWTSDDAPVPGMLTHSPWSGSGKLALLHESR